MITRAQAEALLTLAESLEACEKVGLSVEAACGHDGDVAVRLNDGMDLLEPVPYLRGMTIRLAVNALIPKQET